MSVLARADRDWEVSENESSPATAQAEAVEELLRQLVDARIVLTDRDGAVTRWSRPAEELFRLAGSAHAGPPSVETLAVVEQPPPVRRRRPDRGAAQETDELELYAPRSSPSG